MNGINRFVGSGYATAVKFDQTKVRGDRVCSFILIMPEDRNNKTKVRVNVYGGAVEACDRFLKDNVYVIVDGKVMNRHCRQKDDTVTEVRCEDIKFGETQRREQQWQEA